MHESILLFFPLPICIAHTTAILLHNYCAIHDPLPTPLLYAMNHTKLVLAISCKGQGCVRVSLAGLEVQFPLRSGRSATSVPTAAGTAGPISLIRGCVRECGLFSLKGGVSLMQWSTCRLSQDSSRRCWAYLSYSGLRARVWFG